MAGSSLVLFMLLTARWGAFVAAAETEAGTTINRSQPNQTGQRQCGAHSNTMSDGHVDFMCPAFNSFCAFPELM